MILFIGKGLLGKPLFDAILTRADEDVRLFQGNMCSEHDRIWNLQFGKVTTIVNCAGLVQAKTEEEIVRATAVNLGAVEALCRLCLARDIKLVHLSTEYVFGGEGHSYRPFASWDDLSPDPRCYYGVIKAEADKRVRRLLNSLILRPSVMPEPFRYDKAYTDVISSKVTVEEACHRMANTIVENQYGTVHICGKPRSIYEFVNDEFGQEVEGIPAPPAWRASHPMYTAMQ